MAFEEGTSSKDQKTTTKVRIINSSRTREKAVPTTYLLASFIRESGRTKLFEVNLQYFKNEIENIDFGISEASNNAVTQLPIAISPLPEPRQPSSELHVVTTIPRFYCEYVKKDLTIFNLNTGCPSVSLFPGHLVIF